MDNSSNRIQSERARLSPKLLDHPYLFTPFPVASSQDKRQGYSKRAGSYSSGNLVEDKAYRYKMVQQALSDHLIPLLPPVVRYFDVGCADGKRTQDFIKLIESKSKLERVAAIDYSQGMVEQAKMLLGEDIVDHGDVTNLGFDGEFNVISLMYMVLGNVPEDSLPTALDQIYSATEPGGLACLNELGWDPHFLAENGYDSNNGNHGKYMVYFVRDPEGKPITNDQGKPIFFTQRMFRPGELQSLTSDAGFEIVHQQKIIPTDPRRRFKLEELLILRKN